MVSLSKCLNCWSAVLCVLAFPRFSIGCSDLNISPSLRHITRRSSPARYNQGVHVPCARILPQHVKDRVQPLVPALWGLKQWPHNQPR